jgi:hypothetical protein
VARRKIGADNFNVSFFKNVADVALGVLLHTLPLYVMRNSLSPTYPRFAGALRRVRRLS